jgi:hypothetical protein
MNVVWNRRLAWVIPLLIVAACEQYTEPTPLERETVTFDGRLERSGSFEAQFPVKAQGTVVVTVNSLISVSSSVAATGGLAVGTWDGATCTPVARNENATLATVLAGSAIKGDYCVRLYDVGKFTEAVNYSFEVDHP